jgi:Arc/MetJ-type ribon-helix-helix transcriptional regulator
MYPSPVPARSVQISLPEDLLARLDETAEARSAGRSAVIRKALVSYLDHARRRKTDAAYEQAYKGKGDELLGDLGDLMRRQRWPRK